MRRIHDIKALMSDIIRSMPLSQAIGIYLPLEPDGNDFSCCCPWHNENTPSFKVSDSKSIWKCWGACKGDKDRAGTNIIKFIQVYFNLTFNEAIEKYIQDFQIDLSRHFKEPTNEEKWFDYYTSINKIIANECHARLMSDQNIKDMFNVGKKINDETLAKYNIGYTPDLAFINSIITKHNLDHNHATQLDLTRFDLWGNRVVYPISDENGNIIGFRNRAINDPNVPKFIGTSSNSPLHPSVTPIYGLHVVRQAIRQNDGELVIVEGQNDVLHMYSDQIHNVAGSMGTSLSTEHFKMLEQIGVKKLIVMFDGDEAGQKAMVNFATSLNYCGEMVVCIAQMPLGCDPDEYLLVNQAYKLRSIIADNKHYIDYYFDSVSKPINTIADKYTYLNHSKVRLSTLSGINYHMAIDILSTKLGLPKDAIDDFIKSDMKNDILYNVDAEMMVLCGLMTNEKFRVSTINTTGNEVFYLKKNAILYDLICKMSTDSIPVTSDTVWLKIQNDSMSQLWTQQDFNNIFIHVSDHYDVYLDEIVDRYIRRKADFSADKIKNDVRSLSTNTEKILDGINTSITDLMMYNKSKDVENNINHVDKTIEFIKNQIGNKGRLPGSILGDDFILSTSLLGGLRTGTMNIVSGTSGVGKTALAQKWALYQSVFLKQGVLWIALEMSSDALNLRNASILSRMIPDDGNMYVPDSPNTPLVMLMDDGSIVDNTDFNKGSKIDIPISLIERGCLSSQQTTRIADILEIYRHAPFYVECLRSTNIQQAIALARYYKYTHDIKTVVIDYVQLLNGDGKFEEGWQSQKSVSQYILNNISRELDVNVMAISQLGRGIAQSMKNDNNAVLPDGSDVSGSIQYWQDADAFITLGLKNEMLRRKWPAGTHFIYISKNRNGRAGVIQANYAGDYTDWSEVPNQMCEEKL